MKLKPGFYYSFLRVDVNRRNKEISEGVKHHYVGGVLSDSWGTGPREELIAWGEDACSGDFWSYDDIYPELLKAINHSISEGYEVHVAENVDDIKVAPNDYVITDRNETISK